MADESLEYIIAQLKEYFETQSETGRKIVIWLDEEKQWENAIDSLQLVKVKISRLSDKSQF
jgi:hypothetical protein